MLMLLRGVPTVYSGDEQGFIGDGNDQDARESLFPSRVAVYNDNVLLGTTKTTADSNFDTDHVLFTHIAQLAKLRVDHPALTRGRQVTRNYGEEPGLFAVSRFDPTSRAEYLVAFNTSAQPITVNVEVDPANIAWTTLAGSCATRSTAPGSIALTLPAFGHAVCTAPAN